MRAKQTQLSTNTVSRATNSTGLRNTTSVSNATNTGMKVGNVLAGDYASSLGLSTSTSIVQANGKYYAKEGNNYVDLSPLTSVINATKKATEYAGFRYGVK